MFKLAFWGFIALMILPSVSPVDVKATAGIEVDQVAVAEQKPAFTSMDAMRLAAGVAGDIRGLCERQPGVCETGGEIIHAAFDRARDGAVVLATMVEQHRAERAENVDTIATGSIGD